MQVPLACALSESEMRERRRTVLESVRQRSMQTTSLKEGYAYRFQATSEVLLALSQLVDLERQCCPFLTFTIVVESGGGQIRLEVTGPPEAKPMIADFFGGSSNKY